MSQVRVCRRRRHVFRRCIFYVYRCGQRLRCICVHLFEVQAIHSVCISGYPLSGYPDLSVNFMAAKNPDILK